MPQNGCPTGLTWPGLLRLLSCLLLVVAGAGCAPNATSLRQPTFPPNTKTFALVESDLGANLPDGVDRTIEGRVKQELTKRGLRETPRADADLIVIAYVDTLVRKELRAADSFCYAGGGGELPPGNQWDVQSGCDDDVLTPIERQRLVIAVYAKALNRLVWHGWSATRNAPTLFEGDNVESAIQDILQHFPD